MKYQFILCGPQGIGKTQKAPQLSTLLGGVALVDDWNGNDTLASGTLAVTNHDYVMPRGGFSFHVEDATGLDNLITLLGGDPVNCKNRVRPPYHRHSVPACSLEARYLRSSSMSESNWNACSGCACSPNTLHAANQAGLSVSATIETASDECAGIPLALSTSSSHLVNSSHASDFSISTPPD